MKNDVEDKGKQGMRNENNAFSKAKAKYVYRFIQRLTEAKYYKPERDNGNNILGRSYLSPQEFDVGTFIVLRKLKRKRGVSTRLFFTKIVNIALEFALFCDYGNDVEQSEKDLSYLRKKPDDAVIIRSLKKMEKLELIKYEIDYKRIKNVIGVTKGVTIKFLPLKAGSLKDILKSEGKN